MWSLASLSPLAILPEAAEAPVLCLAATRSGALLAAGFEDGRIALFRTNTGAVAGAAAEVRLSRAPTMRM